MCKSAVNVLLVCEYKPMSHGCHCNGQVASNRYACFYSPQNRVHARRVRKLWRWVGCQSRDHPGSFRVLRIAMKLQPQQQLPCPLTKGCFRRYAQTKDTCKVRDLKGDRKRERMMCNAEISIKEFSRCEASVNVPPV